MMVLAPSPRRALAAALLALSAWAAQAQPAPTAPTASDCPPAPPALTPERLQQEVRAARDRGLLWRVEKDGRRSWLYGTLHVARADWVVPGPTVLRALQGSDLLALELNPLDAESLRPLMAPADPAIAQRVLGLARRARLATQAAALCLPLQALAHQRPVMQAVTLTVLAARREALYAEFAVDAVLASTAQAQRQPIVALEQASEQLALLAGRDDAEEGDLFDSALDELASGEGAEQLRALAQAWADGDLAMLERYPQWCHCLDTPVEREQMKRLLDDRNAPMAGKIAALHEGGRRVFAAVGALHMIGPQGLPTLLRARGFSVTREPWPAAP
ncbi:TraB/GumN family protein [Variovorax terrae]|uniref:TraB/GumN family protein n=1 Tax=Variovorax terrae TaxID=2923278 RepID=A0A9X1VX88_9BURK|nr:TraB/GumN family protein [Variovorax terrae]MCJ0764670.1 TraB/GumN family protein [Variovorax terrae]